MHACILYVITVRVGLNEVQAVRLAEPRAQLAVLLMMQMKMGSQSDESAPYFGTSHIQPVYNNASVGC